MPKITTAKGFILDTEYGMAPSLTWWAAEKGVANTQVFYVEDYSTYLLVVNGQPEFESSEAEAIAVHIDILALAQEKENDG